MSTLLQFIKDVKLDFTQAFFSESSDQELNYTNFEIAPKPVKEACSKADADEILKKIVDAGGKATIK